MGERGRDEEVASSKKNRIEDFRIEWKN